MITTIILSKDRPAQLDLLLRSIEQNGNGQFELGVIWSKSSLDFWEGYESLRAEWRGRSSFHFDAAAGEFEQLIHWHLEGAKEFVCFMCDDGLLYRPPDTTAIVPVHPDVLCFSLRLGQNATVCYPSGLTQEPPPESPWRWVNQHQSPGVTDFGYPGSLDGHVFRTADVWEMLAGREFSNPTALECVLNEVCLLGWHDRRPLMASYPHSMYVGIPVNRVSEQSGVRHGTEFPFDPEEAARRFVAGGRLDLDAAIRECEARVNGAHTEIPLAWEER